MYHAVAERNVGHRPACVRINDAPACRVSFEQTPESNVYSCCFTASLDLDYTGFRFIAYAGVESVRVRARSIHSAPTLVRVHARAYEIAARRQPVDSIDALIVCAKII